MTEDTPWIYPYFYAACHDSFDFLLRDQAKCNGVCGAKGVSTGILAVMFEPSYYFAYA